MLGISSKKEKDMARKQKAVKEAYYLLKPKGKSFESLSQATLWMYEHYKDNPGLRKTIKIVKEVVM